MQKSFLKSMNNEYTLNSQISRIMKDRNVSA